MTPSSSSLAVAWPSPAEVPVRRIGSRVEAVEIARRLAPRIAARTARTEAERMVPRETIRELADEGLFAIATPKAFGGSELGLGAMVEVAATLAAACGSSGWVYGVLTGHNWLVSLFPPEAQAEVFEDPHALTASVFRLASAVTPEEGGYRMTGGEGRFCSGVDHCAWVVVGSAVTHGDGPPEPGFFLVPMSDVEIVDDWFTAGMRGTGSRSIRIKDAFIPAHRMVRTAELMAGTTPGARHHGSATYQLPFYVAQPFSLIGAPLGMAMGSLRDFGESQAKRMAEMGPEQLAEQTLTFGRIADVAADIDAVTALILRDCATLDDCAGPAELGREGLAAIQRDFAYASQKCRYAVTRLFEASGGSGIYEGSAIQRIWRDVNAAAAHVAFSWDTAAAAFGRALVGVPPAPLRR